ncbi:MAG: hypothetical protein AB7D47_13500 [Desulfovibrio sp.]
MISIMAGRKRFKRMTTKGGGNHRQVPQQPGNTGAGAFYCPNQVEPSLQQSSTTRFSLRNPLHWQALSFQHLFFHKTIMFDQDFWGNVK